MAKEVAKPVSSAVPAHLQGGKTARIGNIDQSDLIIPRIKLLQAISPEVTDHDNAKPGQFWHTVAGEVMGAELRAIPIILRKSYVLWAPRNDDRGILARSNDAIHWDKDAGTKFTVRPKNSPHDVTYVLGRTVGEKTGDGPALTEFGSSIPGNGDSPPAAALTYQMLWYFPDKPELSPAVIINTRSSIRPAKVLLSKIDLRPVEHYGQVFKIGVTQEKGDEGPYFNYTYVADGYATEEEFAATKAIYDRFRDSDWRANDETEDPDKAANGPARSREDTYANDPSKPKF
jgi:hypothetical protein